MGTFTDNYGSLNWRGWTASLLGGITLLIGSCVGSCSITNNWNYSEGDRVGMVNKISKRGAIWETYEGQMALEGIVSGGQNTAANVWDFAVDNYWEAGKQEILVNQLKEVMDSGQKVKIHYKQMVATFPWRSGNNALIQSIEPISSKVGNTNYPAPTSLKPRQDKKATGNLEVSLDGKNYLLRHDVSGKLKITEMREVQ